MTKLSKKQKTLILTFSTLAYIIIFLIAEVPLFSKSYVLKDSDIFKLDSIKILNRAYYLTSSKSASKSGLEFEDLTLKTFQLESSGLNNEEELKTLFDTLQFSKTKVTVYTNEQGFRNYQDQTNDNKILALNVTVGDKSIGDTNSVNANAARKLNFLFIAATFGYGLFLISYYNKIRT